MLKHVFTRSPSYDLMIVSIARWFPLCQFMPNGEELDVVVLICCSQEMAMRQKSCAKGNKEIAWQSCDEEMLRVDSQLTCD